MEEPVAKISCRLCGEPIAPSAKKCVHCGSYQDWRGVLAASSTVLSLLVALVSVSTVAVPVVKKTFTREQSNVELEPVGSFPGSHTFLAQNSGNRPGVIGVGRLDINFGRYRESHVLAAIPRSSGESWAKSRIIEPGKVEIIGFRQTAADNQVLAPPGRCEYRIIVNNWKRAPEWACLRVECYGALMHFHKISEAEMNEIFEAEGGTANGTCDPRKAYHREPRG